jgi:Family of unknown function (DUF6455)
MCGFDEFDRPFSRLGEMMERLGLDPIAALQCEAAALAPAIYRCRTCESDTVCRDWLARSAATVEAPPAFCPNSGLLTDVRGKRPPADIGCWL